MCKKQIFTSKLKLDKIVGLWFLCIEKPEFSNEFRLPECILRLNFLDGDDEFNPGTSRFALVIVKIGDRNGVFFV